MQKQISTIISLKDRFSAPLLKMSKNVEKLDKETRSSMNRVNRWGLQVEKSVDRALKSTAKWAKRGAILLGGASMKKGLEGVFEVDSAARKVKSIAGEALELKDIQQDLMDMNYKYGKSFTDLGDSWYDAISASVPMEDTLKAVELAHKMSTAGFTEDSEAMKLLATASNAFDLKGVEAMERMADQILLTQNKGVILVGDMAQGYGSINTLSKSIGASFEEQSAAIATMTKMGMTPSEAITSYKAILNAFLNETSDKTAAYLEEFGLGADFLSAKTFKELGFTGVISEVMEATGGDLDKISKIFKNIRGKTGASIFTGEGLEEYKEIFELMESGSDGALDMAFSEIENSLGYQWNLFKEKIKNLNTELWLGAESPLSEMLKNANDWLDNNKDKVKEWIQDVQSWVADLIDKFIELLKVVKENEEFFKGLGKALLGLYVLRKVSRWMKDLEPAFGAIKDVFKAIKGKEIVSGLLDGAGLMSLVKPLLIIYGVFKFIQYMVENWGDLQERFPKFTGLIEWLGNEGVEIIKTFIKVVVEGIMFIFELLEWMIIPILEFIFDTIMGVIDSVINLVEGMIKIVSGAFGIILGFFGDNTETMRQGWETLTEGMQLVWDDLVSKIESPVKMILDLFDFDSKIEEAKSKWESFTTFIKSPVSSTIRIYEERKATRIRNRHPKSDEFGINYKGTPSWKGGLTYLNERGGEIYDLPRGTRIYPHDQSVQMAFEDGMSTGATGGQVSENVVIKMPLNFYGDVVGDEEYINKVGTQIVTVVKKELANI